MKNIKNPENRKILQGINSPEKLFTKVRLACEENKYEHTGCKFLNIPQFIDFGYGKVSVSDGDCRCPFPPFEWTYEELPKEYKEIMKKIYLIAKILEII
jgi:hypothetical protein